MACIVTLEPYKKDDLFCVSLVFNYDDLLQKRYIANNQIADLLKISINDYNSILNSSTKPVIKKQFVMFSSYNEVAYYNSEAEVNSTITKLKSKSDLSKIAEQLSYYTH